MSWDIGNSSAGRGVRTRRRFHHDGYLTTERSSKTGDEIVAEPEAITILSTGGRGHQTDPNTEQCEEPRSFHELAKRGKFRVERADPRSAGLRACGGQHRRHGGLRHDGGDVRTEPAMISQLRHAWAINLIPATRLQQGEKVEQAVVVAPPALGDRGVP